MKFRATISSLYKTLQKRGYVFLSTLVILALLISVAIAIGSLSLVAYTGSQRAFQALSAQAAADAGGQDFLQKLASGESCAGAISAVVGAGRYDGSFNPESPAPSDSQGCVAEITGTVTKGTRVVTRKIKLTARRSGGGDNGCGSSGEITKVSESSNAVVASGMDLNKPADVQPGDVMLAAFAVSSGAHDSVTGPAGWRRYLGGYARSGSKWISSTYFAKTASSSEGSTYHFSFPSATAIGKIVDFRNAFYNGQDISNSPTSGLLHTSGSIKTEAANSMLVGFWEVRTTNGSAVTLTPPSGMAGAAEPPNGDTDLLAACVKQPRAEDSGSKTASSSVSAIGTNELFVLMPKSAVAAISHGNSPATGTPSSISVSNAAQTGEDIVIYHVIVTPKKTDITASCGATKITQIDHPSNNLSTAYFWKLAVGSNSCTFSWAGAANVADAQIKTFGNVDRTDPIVTSGGLNTSGTIHDTPSIDTSPVDFAHLFALWSFATPCPSTFTIPPDMYANDGTGGCSIGSGDPYGIGHKLGDKQQTPPGSSGPKRLTASTSANSGTAYLMALRPKNAPVEGGGGSPGAWKLKFYQQIPNE